MDDILGLTAMEMAGKSFKCSCGRVHGVGIKNIIIGKDVLPKILDIATDFNKGQIFLIADNNTYPSYGSLVETLLTEEEFDLKKYVFKSESPIIPDEKAIGRLLVEIDKGTSLIVAVGSGSINDMARFLSYRLNIPYIIIATAPSMDGYASVVSPLIIEGFKKTFEATSPFSIIGDVNILKDAPIDMIRAGFGDIIGKFTALTDWQLSKFINNEYYCETSVQLINNAIQKCTDNADKISSRDGQVVEYIMEALVLSGVAMGLVGNSRPASGAEHHLAHYWEMDAIAHNRSHALHGNAVGVGAVVISSIYEIMADKCPKEIVLPDPNRIKSLLDRAGSCTNPKDLGISRELFRRSIIHAREVRPRYTILQLAYKMNMLDKIADALVEKFYM